MKVLLATDSTVLRRSVSQALAGRGHNVRVLTRAGAGAPTQ
jgi:DNA-binding response OmpR family regulator